MDGKVRRGVSGSRALRLLFGHNMSLGQNERRGVSMQTVMYSGKNRVSVLEMIKAKLARVCV